MFLYASPNPAAFLAALASATTLRFAACAASVAALSVAALASVSALSKAVRPSALPNLV